MTIKTRKTLRKIPSGTDSETTKLMLDQKTDAILHASITSKMLISIIVWKKKVTKYNYEIR